MFVILWRGAPVGDEKTYEKAEEAIDAFLLRDPFLTFLMADEFDIIEVAEANADYCVEDVPEEEWEDYL